MEHVAEQPPRFKANTLWTLAALMAGFGVGMAANRWGWTWLDEPVSAAAPVGRLWCDALRLLAYPLVVCVLVRGLNIRDGRLSAGSMGAIAMGVFVVVLVVGGALALLLAPPLIEWLGVERGVLHAGVGGAIEPAAAGSSNWLFTILGGPLGPSIAGGNLIPILLVSIAFALAVRTLGESSRTTILRGVEAITGALFVLLGWLLAAAPVGVFILTLESGVSTGTVAAGAFAMYVMMLVVLLVLLNLLLYPLTGVAAGMSIVRYAVGIAPAQGVAAGTRSSLASLPAMLDSARRLGIPEGVAGFVLPMAVGIFKANRTVTGISKVLFLAHVYAVELSPATLTAYILMVMLLSFASPGTPSGGVMASTPALLAAGIPMEGIVLAYAVDAIPDVFKTLVNVTGDLSATAIVARWTRGRSSPAGEAP
ncbi:MAG: amino acid:proton symporter [Phycisphaerae bacterium]|nr:MAG: amino acid:proton symporter [Phycisphaerae bacterium]